MAFYQSVSVFVCLIFVVFGNLDVKEGEVCKEENGKQWICKKIPDCQYPLKVLEDERQEPPFCQFNGSKPIVCCDPDFSAGKSTDKCKQYAEAVFKKRSKGDTTPVDTCVEDNNSSNSSISRNALPRKYPHMALIGFGDEPSIKWLCAGSLISNQYVLSVAHCAASSLKPKWIRLGEYNLNSTDDEKDGKSQPVTYEIKEVVVHPDYKPPSVYNDIALYKLNDTVQFNEYIRPVCLQKGHEVRTDYLTVAGWGHKEWRGKRNDILQEINVDEIKFKRCAGIFNETAKMINGIREGSMICAGDFESGGDICVADSGSPLMQRLQDPYCMYSLVGIASLHKTCGGPPPGVYTRVSNYVPWIEALVWP